MRALFYDRNRGARKGTKEIVTLCQGDKKGITSNVMKDILISFLFHYLHMRDTFGFRNISKQIKLYGS